MIRIFLFNHCTLMSQSLCPTVPSYCPLLKFLVFVFYNPKILSLTSQCHIQSPVIVSYSPQSLCPTVPSYCLLQSLVILLQSPVIIPNSLLSLSPTIPSHCILEFLVIVSYLPHSCSPYVPIYCLLQFSVIVS